MCVSLTVKKESLKELEKRGYQIDILDLPSKRQFVFCSPQNVKFTNEEIAAFICDKLPHCFSSDDQGLPEESQNFNIVQALVSASWESIFIGLEGGLYPLYNEDSKAICDYFEKYRN